MSTRSRLRDDDGYLRLRGAILRGDLGPNQRLVEADMSSAFELPRAAVRTALVRLEHEGLIEREPHRGARVRLVTEQEAVEILEARAALEGLAASQAAKGRVLRVVLINGSGGAIAPSWNAAFVFDGSAPASPASGAHKSVTFEYDGTNWREIHRSG